MYCIFFFRLPEVHGCGQKVSKGEKMSKNHLEKDVAPKIDERKVNQEHDRLKQLIKNKKNERKKKN
jgi:hypothetical protein